MDLTVHRASSDGCPRCCPGNPREQCKLPVADLKLWIHGYQICRGARHEHPVHPVRRAQPGAFRLLREPDRPHAEPRCPGEERYPLRERLLQFPHMCPVAGLHRHRRLRAQDRLLDSAAPYDGRVRAWHTACARPATTWYRSGNSTIAGPRTTADLPRLSTRCMSWTESETSTGCCAPRGGRDGWQGNSRRRPGRGQSAYTRYDSLVADTTVRWLRERGNLDNGKPWVLFSSMVSPHYPLIAPAEFYDLYEEEALPCPRLYDRELRPDHPVISHYRETWNYDDHFDERSLRSGLQAYYGLCSFLDFQIGRILAALEESGFRMTPWSSTRRITARVSETAACGENP